MATRLQQVAIAMRGYGTVTPLRSLLLGKAGTMAITVFVAFLVTMLTRQVRFAVICVVLLQFFMAPSTLNEVFRGIHKLTQAVQTQVTLIERTSSITPTRKPKLIQFSPVESEYKTGRPPRSSPSDGKKPPSSSDENDDNSSTAMTTNTTRSSRSYSSEPTEFNATAKALEVQDALDAATARFSNWWQLHSEERRRVLEGQVGECIVGASTSAFKANSVATSTTDSTVPELEDIAVEEVAMIPAGALINEVESAPVSVPSPLQALTPEPEDVAPTELEMLVAGAVDAVKQLIAPTRQSAEEDLVRGSSSEELVTATASTNLIEQESTPTVVAVDTMGDTDAAFDVTPAILPVVTPTTTVVGTPIIEEESAPAPLIPTVNRALSLEAPTLAAIPSSSIDLTSATASLQPESWRQWGKDIDWGKMRMQGSDIYSKAQGNPPPSKTAGRSALPPAAPAPTPVPASRYTPRNVEIASAASAATASAAAAKTSSASSVSSISTVSAAVMAASIADATSAFLGSATAASVALTTAAVPMPAAVESTVAAAVVAAIESVPLQPPVALINAPATVPLSAVAGATIVAAPAAVAAAGAAAGTAGVRASVTGTVGVVGAAVTGPVPVPVRQSALLSAASSSSFITPTFSQLLMAPPRKPFYGSKGTTQVAPVVTSPPPLVSQNVTTTAVMTAADVAAVAAAQREELAWVESVLQRARDRAYHHRLWGWGKGKDAGGSSSGTKLKASVEDVLGAVAWVGFSVFQWVGNNGGGHT